MLEKRVGVSLTARTYRKYVQARDKFYSVIKKESPVNAITNAVVRNYVAMLGQEFDTALQLDISKK